MLFTSESSSRLTGFGIAKTFWLSADCTRMHPRKSWGCINESSSSICSYTWLWRRKDAYHRAESIGQMASNKLCCGGATMQHDWHLGWDSGRFKWHTRMASRNDTRWESEETGGWRIQVCHCFHYWLFLIKLSMQRRRFWRRYRILGVAAANRPVVVMYSECTHIKNRKVIRWRPSLAILVSNWCLFTRFYGVNLTPRWRIWILHIRDAPVSFTLSLFIVRRVSSLQRSQTWMPCSNAGWAALTWEMYLWVDIRLVVT